MEFFGEFGNFCFFRVGLGFFWGVWVFGEFVILSAAKNPHFKGANSHFKFVDTSLSYESSV